MNIMNDRCVDTENFIINLENIYGLHSIYRTIIVCKDNIDFYEELLDKKNYSVYKIYNFEDIDYDSLDKRVFLINEDFFINFIKEINIKYKKMFYNLVTFTPYCDKNNIIKEYKDLVNHCDDYFIF